MAAKAAGLKLGEIFAFTSSDKWVGWRDQDNTIRGWNPLDDDGEALRLAVDLDFGIEVHRSLAVVHAGNGEQPKVSVHWNLVDVPDARTATRRAIVRAAAAIGEQMP